MAQKKTIIKKIKAIITEWGSFTTAEVEATSSPVVASIGKNTFQLAERFNLDGVVAVMYVHDRDTDEDEDIAYEDLKKDVLEEILFLAEQWDTDNLKTEKRCSN